MDGIYIFLLGNYSFLLLSSVFLPFLISIPLDSPFVFLFISKRIPFLFLFYLDFKLRGIPPFKNFYLPLVFYSVLIFIFILWIFYLSLDFKLRGIPPKSLLYLFVNESAVPSIPLESVFALTPLISEGRFRILNIEY